MPDWIAESEAAFDAYVDALIGVVGHADRAEPLNAKALGHFSKAFMMRRTRPPSPRRADLGDASVV